MLTKLLKLVNPNGIGTIQRKMTLRSNKCIA